MARPRGGQLWRRKSDTTTVRVETRRTFNPMQGVRNHSEARWSMLLWTDAQGRFGVAHESDFVADYEYVGPAPFVERPAPSPAGIAPKETP